MVPHFLHVLILKAKAESLLLAVYQLGGGVGRKLHDVDETKSVGFKHLEHTTVWLTQTF